MIDSIALFAVMVYILLAPIAAIYFSLKTKIIIEIEIEELKKEIKKYG